MDYNDNIFNYRDYMNYKLKDECFGIDEFISNDFLESLSDNIVNYPSNSQTDSFLSVVYDISEGLKNNLFKLNFQPQYNLATQEIIGFEALVRLKNSNNHNISPTTFIPIAECTDQIYELEQWIFKTALEYKKLWEEQGNINYYMSINLSVKTLIHDDYFDQLMNILKSFKIDYKYLIIEITETGIIFDPDKAYENLKKIKVIGINIALDDFGTGFSSLTHLEELPIDIVKFDRTMLQKIPKNNKSCAILKAITALSHDLGYKVIAEGIENYEQLDYLLDLGCKVGQGFLFAEPMTFCDLKKLCY